MKDFVNIFSNKLPSPDYYFQAGLLHSRTVMENLNIINRLSNLNRCRSVPCDLSLLDNHRHRMKVKGRVRNNTETPSPDYSLYADSIESILEINSSSNSKDNSVEHLDNRLGVMEFPESRTTDFQNNMVTEQHQQQSVCLVRRDSFPCVDSGFSSSGCLSDEKDDVSFPSQNCSLEHDDSSSSSATGSRRISLSSFSSSCSRLRSLSLDSDTSSSTDTSSELINPKLSSSLPPNYTMSEHHRLLPKPLDQLHCANLSREGSLRRTAFISGREKSRAVPSSDTEEEEDDTNNNKTSCFLSSSSKPDSKDLLSRLPTSPLHLADVFQNHGVMSLVGCICYTLVLVFVVGVGSIFLELFKKFVSPNDWQDLKQDLKERNRRRELLSSSSSRSRRHNGSRR